MWETSLLATAGVALGGLILYMLAWLDARRKTERPKVYCSSDVSAALISLCPTMNKPYQPFPMLTNGHVETIFAAKMRSNPHVEYQRECVAMPDGGCVALDW